MRPPGICRTMLLVCLWTALPSAAEPPVLLRDVLVQAPPEAAGTGLAPEVKVRVTVDERGLVEQVECLAIEPSSQLDEVFRASVREQLGQLRYAPARENGKPAKSKLEWKVKFQPRLPGSGDRPTFSIPLLPSDFVAADFRERVTRQVALVPYERQREILLEYSEVAEQALVRERRRQFESPNFLVVTDAQDPRVAEWAAANLEAAFAFLDELWRKDIEPLPRKLKILVYLYQSHAQFADSSQRLAQRFGYEASYMAPGLVRWRVEEPSAEHLVALLIHEASHAYLDHHLLPPGLPLPRWLEEGFAEYVANSEIRDGKLVPGRLAQRRFAWSHGAGQPRLVQTEAGDDARTLRTELAKKDGLRLERLLTLEQAEFYSERFQVYYAASWVLVHFLRHGRPEWQGLFPQMMLYVVEGFPIGEAVPAVYGVRLEELDEEYRRYARKFLG